MLDLQSVSPRIAKCAGMIASKAYQTYRRISPEHRRWIDPEDIIQDGLMCAFLTEQKTYSANKGAKYSTYLYQGLDFHLAHGYTTPLGQQKRAGFLVELDAPVSEDGEAFFELPSLYKNQEDELSALKAFYELCRAVSPSACGLLISGILFGKWSGPLRDYSVQLQELATKAKNLGVRLEDLRTLYRDEKLRKKALTQVTNSAIIGLGTAADVRVLECVECRGQFALSAVQEGRYFVETTTCWVCYRKLQKALSVTSCFGKKKRRDAEGYSETDVECRLHCRDRKICRRFISQKENVMSDAATQEAEEAVKDVDLGDAQPAKTAKKTKKASGKAKTAAKAETKKAKAKDEDAPPSDFPGGKWPFKANSMMLYCFQRCLKGVKQDELIAEIKKASYNPRIMVGLMRRGPSKVFVQRNPSHTWKLDEAGGRFKIYDVKFVGKAKAVKAEPAAKPKKKK